MLKKAGIVAAAGAASLVALSPLAFASDTHTHDNNNNNGNTKIIKKITDDRNYQVGSNGEQVASKDSAGLVNLSNNNLNFSPQTCFTSGNGNSLIQGALGGFMSDAKNKSAVDSDNGVNCTNAADNGDQVTQNSNGKHHASEGKGTK